MNRRGAALLAVLWLLTAVASLALAAVTASRETQMLADNRIARMRADWLAEGCAMRRLAELESLMRGGLDWEELSLPESSPFPIVSTCHGELTAAGARLDLNHASGARLRRLFSALELPNGSADSLVDAVLDWRDGDNAARALGAERTWYLAHQRQAPADGPFTNAEEVLLVRGGEVLAPYLHLLSVDEDLTPVNLAPLLLVGTLPGVGSEALEALRIRRRAGSPLRSLTELESMLSGPARDSFYAQFAALTDVATVRPAAWILTVSASAGTPALTRTIELRIGRNGERLVITRRRQW